MIASFLGYVNLRIKGDPKEKPLVIWFDTEQSPYHLGKMIKRVCALIKNENPANLMIYKLRTCSTNERIQIIDYVIKSNPAAGLIVIDGIRDLVYDINSPEEATTTVTRLMNWSTENNVHIINVLHQNKGDGNARGHLGTELTNKSETVLSVEATKGTSISVVDGEYCREKNNVEPLSFVINEDSNPELCDLPVNETTKKRTEPQLIPYETHERILVEVFNEHKEIKYKDFCKTIKEKFEEEAGIVFGLNKSRDYLSYYLKEAWVNKDEATKNYKYAKAIF